MSRTCSPVSVPVATISTPLYPALTAGKSGYVASVPSQADSTYTWSITNGAIASGQGTNSIVFWPMAPGTLVLEAKVENAASTMAVADKSIQVVPPPIVQFMGLPSQITGSRTYEVRVPPQPDSTYAWQVSAGSIVSGQGTPTLQFEAPHSGPMFVRCQVMNLARDYEIKDLHLTVIAPPDVNITAPAKILKGEQNVVASVPVQAFSTYAWTISGGTLTSPANGRQITFTADDDDVVSLAVVVLNSLGYADSGMKEVPVAWGYSTAVGDLISARNHARAATLQDGRVLVAGGRAGSTLRTAEIFSPQTGSFTAAASMADERSEHTMTVLPDGRVLVAGGRASPGGTAYASAEIFDPSTGSWSPAPAMGEARFSHSAILLADGRVLVAGGQTIGGGLLDSAEIFDPATGSWSSAGRMSQRLMEHEAVLMADGRVFVAGNEMGNPDRSAHIFDPSTGTWLTAASGAYLPWFTTPVSLPNGRVLLAGGTDFPAPTFQALTLDSSRIYIPTSNTFIPAAPMNTPRAGHMSYVLPSGWVVLAGGYQVVGPISGVDYVASQAVELYDPVTDTYRVAEDLLVPRLDAASAVLPDGRLLVIGGTSAAGAVLQSAEIYSAAL